MAIGRDHLDQLKHLLRPVATRIANSIARGVVQLVDDSKKMQLLQIGVLADETVEGAGGAEHFQPYGFSSVPLVGAEHVVLFPNGDREHPMVIAVADRRYRPTGRPSGEINVYHYRGAKIRMLEDGNIELYPGPGGEVLIRDDGGSVDRLVKKSEFDGHTHPAGTLTAPGGGGPVTGVSGGAAAVTGTQRLRVQ